MYTFWVDLHLITSFSHLFQFDDSKSHSNTSFICETNKIAIFCHVRLTYAYPIYARLLVEPNDHTTHDEFLTQCLGEQTCVIPPQSHLPLVAYSYYEGRLYFLIPNKDTSFQLYYVSIMDTRYGPIYSSSSSSLGILNRTIGESRIQGIDNHEERLVFLLDDKDNTIGIAFYNDFKRELLYCTFEIEYDVHIPNGVTKWKHYLYDQQRMTSIHQPQFNLI